MLRAFIALVFLLASSTAFAADRVKELHDFIDGNLHFGAHFSRAVTGETVEALKKEVTPEDIPALVTLLGHKRNAIRTGASKGLGVLGSAALPALEEAAKSPDFNTSFMAKETIDNINGAGQNSREKQVFPDGAGIAEAPKKPEEAKPVEEKPEAVADIPLPPAAPDWKTLTPITEADLATAKTLPEEKRMLLEGVFSACARDAHIAGARLEGDYLRLWIELIGLPQPAGEEAAGEEMGWAYAVYSETQKGIVAHFNGGPNGIACLAPAPAPQEEGRAPKRQAGGFNR